MVIHCAMMNKVTPANLKLVQYLIKVYPSAVDAKSIAGYSPLWLACSLGRTEFAKLLIDAGADQMTKDSVYSNRFVWTPDGMCARDGVPSQLA